MTTVLTISVIAIIAWLVFITVKQISLSKELCEEAGMKIFFQGLELNANRKFREETTKNFLDLQKQINSINYDAEKVEALTKHFAEQVIEQNKTNEQLTELATANLKNYGLLLTHQHDYEYEDVKLYIKEPIIYHPDGRILHVKDHTQECDELFNELISDPEEESEESQDKEAESDEDKTTEEAEANTEIENII